jgi:hypothetical protein
MKKQVKILVAILVLAMATLACSVAIPGLGGPLLEDNFEGSNQIWGTGTDAQSAVEYENGGLRFQVYDSFFFVWSTPGDEDYSNVRIEVTAKNSSTDLNTGFGIICNQNSTLSDNMYYFAVTTNGQYAIAKGSVALEDVFLTNNDEWADSDLIPVDAASYRIAAECGNGTLTLYVNDQKIDSVQDSTYTSGNVALFVWSDELENGSDITFDDFVMNRLPEP